MPTCSSTASTHHRRPARRHGPRHHPSPATPGTQNVDPANADRHAAAGSALLGDLALAVVDAGVTGPTAVRCRLTGAGRCVRCIIVARAGSATHPAAPG